MMVYDKTATVSGINIICLSHYCISRVNKYAMSACSCGITSNRSADTLKEATKLCFYRVLIRWERPVKPRKTYVSWMATCLLSATRGWSDRGDGACSLKIMRYLAWSCDWACSTPANKQTHSQESIGSAQRGWTVITNYRAQAKNRDVFLNLAVCRVFLLLLILTGHLR